MPPALLLLFLALLPLESNGFAVGDATPCARRGQFHGSRTQWHDLLGKHCPKFGHSKTVALPLPRPLGFMAGDEYKLSLSFDGDRHLTPWLTLIGKQAPEVPLVDVELWHAGGAIESVRAKAEPVPLSYLMLHSDLIAEFRNDSHWPKHVLVHYHWRDSSDVDEVLGLYLLLGVGLTLSSAAIALTLSSTRGLGTILSDLSTSEAPPKDE